ncbi:hypothetical protein [Streptomyces roseolus]
MASTGPMHGFEPLEEWDLLRALIRAALARLDACPTCSTARPEP